MWVVRDLCPCLSLNEFVILDFTQFSTDYGDLHMAHYVRSSFSVFLVAVLSSTVIALTPRAQADELPILTNESTWLETINYFRTATGLKPVVEDLKITTDAQAHADYLANTDPSFFTGQYVSRHTENPASPYYKGRGLFSNVASSGDSNPVTFIYQWIQAPFHTIGLFREGLQSVGLGIAHNNTTGMFEAAIDVGQGLKSQPRTQNIFFPGNNSFINMDRFMGEFPDPREGCGADWKDFTGLPAFISLVNSPPPGMSATITEPSGRVFTSESDLCIVNKYNFKTSDTNYGPAGKSIIDQENLILLFVKDTLEAGKNLVALKVDGQPEYKWAFTVISAPKIVEASFDYQDLKLNWKESTVDSPNQIVGYEIRITEDGFKNPRLFRTDGLAYDLNDLPDGKYWYCVNVIGKYRNGSCSSYWGMAVDHTITPNEPEVNFPYTISGNRNLFLVGSSLRIGFQTTSKNQSISSTPQICSLTITSYGVSVKGLKTGLCSIEISQPRARKLAPVNVHYDFNVTQQTTVKCYKGKSTVLNTGYPGKCPAGYSLSVPGKSRTK